MGFGVVDVKRFGGVALSSDPADVGLDRALVASNVALAHDRSYVRTRDGLAILGAEDAMGAGRTALRLIDVGDTGGVRHLMAIVDGTTDSYAYTFTVLGVATLEHTWTKGSAAFHDAIVFGTPSTSSVFVTTVGQTMQRFVSGGMGPSVGAPKYLGVTPVSNRLVQAWFASAAGSPTGANGSKETVFFSDAGAPTTYSANNYVHLRPGDGEEIRGVATWRGQTFVFKESVVFIFGPEGVSSSGTPVFDNRAVSLPSRIRPAAFSADAAATSVGAGDSGVYYRAIDGVYVTTGGPPRRISQPLDDPFRRNTILGSNLSVVGARVVLHGGNELFVYDDRHGEWVQWESLLGLPTAPFVSWPYTAPDDSERLYWAVGDTLFYTDEGLATDYPTQAITSLYQTGFSDLGAPSVKTVRQVQAWGTGAPTVSIGVDYGSPDTGAAMTLGSSPAVDDAIQRQARRGTTFSLKVAAASGAWRLNNAALHVRRPRPPGAKP